MERSVNSVSLVTGPGDVCVSVAIGKGSCMFLHGTYESILAFAADIATAVQWHESSHAATEPEPAFEVKA